MDEVPPFFPPDGGCYNGASCPVGKNRRQGSCPGPFSKEIKGVGAFRNEALWHWESHFDGAYETIESGGAVMNACWVLDRAPAGFIKKPKPQEGGGCLWDYAATACLYEELGAMVSDCVGNTLDLNSRDSLFMNREGVLYASHHEISKRLQNAV